MPRVVAQGFTTLTKLNETIQVKLSNDISAIPCYNNETPKPEAFANAYTFVEGFRGDNKIPSSELIIGELKFSKGVEAGVIENKIFINNLTELGGYVDIPVSYKNNFLGAYRFNAVKQLDGAPGAEGEQGVGYTLNINGGNRGFAYSAIGNNPEPNTTGTFTLELLKNGKPVEPSQVSWSSGGNLSGSLSGSSRTFSPTISKTYSEVSSFVRAVVKDGTTSITQTIPIVCTKHADGLDWLEDWDKNAVIVDKQGKKIISPKMFAGTKDRSGRITGVALGRDVLNNSNTSQTTGVVGYKNNLPVFSLSDRADFYISSRGNAGSVVDGTANGMYFDGSKLYVTGSVKIQSGTIGSNNVNIDTVIDNASNANNKVQNSIVKVDAQYIANNSPTQMPSENDGRWSTNPPMWQEGRYIWSRNKIALMNGKEIKSKPVCITGHKGENGSVGKDGVAGQGIESITELYQMTGSKAQLPTPTNDSEWTTNPPEWKNGKYVHSCFKIVYNNPEKIEYTKPVCDSSWEAVNDIEIGGRNILQKQSIRDAFNLTGVNQIVPEHEDCVNGFYLVGERGGRGSIRIPNVFKQKGLYTISFKIRGSENSEASFFIDICDKGSYSVRTTSDNTWKKIVITHNVDNYSEVYNFIDLNAISWNFFFIKDFKVEEGNKATDWTPTPEDVQQEIDDVGSVANSATTIAGNANSLAQQTANNIEDFTLEIEGHTKVKGDMIVDGTITSNAIKTGSFTIIDSSTKKPTFSINTGGSIEMDGLLRSSNFDINKWTGYRISPDGRAVLNQAEIRGDIKLPNAGITNYGAQIGNENLALSSQGLISKGESRDSFIEKGTFTGGQSVTISADFDCLNMVAGSQDRVGFEGPIPLTNGETIWFGVWHNIHEGNFTGRKSATFEIPPGTTGTLTSVHWYSDLIDDSKTIKGSVGNLKVELGREASPWCPARKDDLNPVRFWAGKDYEYRNSAPFQVKQNGDVVANNVMLSGRLSGDLDSGHLHITNGSFVIDGQHAYMKNGKMFSFEREADMEYVRLDSGQCVLNTDVSLGNNDVQYFKRDKKLELSLSKINVDSLALRMELDKHNGLHTYGREGAHHQITTDTNPDRVGALIVSSEGAQSREGDIIFTRKNFLEKCQIKIDGNLTLDEDIKSTKNKIELKASSEGWGFYAY